MGKGHEETRDKKEGGYLSGGVEDKVGKVTTQLAALKEESVASVALSLTFRGKSLSSLWTPVLYRSRGLSSLQNKLGASETGRGLEVTLNPVSQCFALAESQEVMWGLGNVQSRR